MATELDPLTAGIIRDLARRVLDHETRIRSLARGSQARHRSVEGGAQSVYDEDDELRAIVGELEDGSYGITTYGGAAPVAPSVPLVTAIPGGATITWDGFDANDEQGWPDNFARVRIHQSTIPGDPPDAENTIGSFDSPAGGALTIAHPADVTTFVYFVAVTTAGVESVPSAEVEVVGGDPGAGAEGLSAYDVAVANGFVGTEAEWLASLAGAAGDPGPAGDPGGPGLSAYQVALANGFAGTEAEWLASLEGPQGDPAPPPAAPSVSPTLTTTGFKDAITVEAHGTLEPGWVLDYYIDGVLAETAASPIRLFQSTPAGVKFQPDQDYVFTVVARLDATAAPASPGVAGRLNPQVDSETILGVVKAGFALLGGLTVGNITIKPPSGDPVADPDHYDPGGIVIPLAGGTAITFPADGSAAVIEAILRTADLIVSGGLTLNGLNNYINGKLILGSGTPDPATKTKIGLSWTPRTAKLNGVTPGPGQLPMSLARNSAGRYATIYPDLETGGHKLLKIFDGTTHNVVKTLDSDTEFLDMMSVTAVGANWHVLGYRWNATVAENQLRLHTYDSAGNLLAQRWLEDEFGARIAGPTAYWAVAVAADPSGNYVHVAKVLGNARVKIWKFATVYTVLPPSDWFSTAAGTGCTMLSGAYYVGHADYGTSGDTNVRHYLAGDFAVGTRVAAFDPVTFAEVPANSFSFDNWVPGLIFDGGRFVTVTYDTTNGMWLNDLNTTKVDTTVYAQHAWVSTSGKRSLPSAVASYAVPRRAWPTLTVPAPPKTGSGGDLADKVNVYLDTDATTKLLTTVTTGLAATLVVTAMAGTGAAPNPGPATEFTAADATGIIQSLLANIILRGDGSWQLGQMTGTGDGKVAFPMSTVTLAAGGTYTGSITFIKTGQVVHAFGYVDRAAGFDVNLHTTGITVPTGFRPAVDVVGKALPAWNTTAQYRYRINATGDVRIQQTAAIGVFQAIQEMWVAA